MYGLNSKYIGLVGHTDRWFKQSPFSDGLSAAAGGNATTVDARYSIITTFGNMTVPQPSPPTSWCPASAEPLRRGRVCRRLPVLVAVGGTNPAGTDECRMGSAAPATCLTGWSSGHPPLGEPKAQYFRAHTAPVGTAAVAVQPSPYSHIEYQPDRTTGPLQEVHGPTTTPATGSGSPGRVLPPTTPKSRVRRPTRRSGPE